MRGMDNGTGGGIKVSVVIPVYQVENYLERAVDSVLAQTLEEKEIILVDDGSEDASPEICDRYAEAYPELIRVIHQENQGLGMARNAGARAAGENTSPLWIPTTRWNRKCTPRCLRKPRRVPMTW